jgi:hypothetical protein
VQDAAMSWSGAEGHDRASRRDCRHDFRSFFKVQG